MFGSRMLKKKVCPHSNTRPSPLQMYIYYTPPPT